MTPFCRGAIALAIGLTALPAVLAADPRAELGKLFAAGTKNTTPSVELARQHAVSLKRANLQDMRIDYAYGLVLANQRRYADSARLLTRYLTSEPGDLWAHRVKLWTDLQSGQYRSALDSMTKLGDLLVLPPDGQPSADQIDAAKYLGTCLAYLDAIRPKGIDEQSVSETSSAIVARIGEHYRIAFDEGRRAVSSELALLEANRDARLKRAEDAEAEKVKQIEAELNSSKENLAQQRDQLQNSTEQTRESQRELGVIRQQLASLGQDRARIAAQMVALQVQLEELQHGTTSNRNNDAVREGDVFSSRTTNTRNTIPLDLLAQAQALALSLAGLNKQAFDMDRLILSLQTRGAELSGVSQAEFRKLSESQAAAEKAARRAEKLAKQLERQEADAKKRPSGPTGRMTQFSTYAPLPYEEECQRVLGWFE